MPKGVKTGNPTNIVCWLVGGHFDNTVWGIAYDKDNLLDEIRMVHYENELANKMGVKILGITKQEDGDVMVEDIYTLCYYQDIGPSFAIFASHDELAAYQDNPEVFVNVFKAEKGYDLPTEHLDPEKMSGKTKVVDVG